MRTFFPAGDEKHFGPVIGLVIGLVIGYWWPGLIPPGSPIINNAPITNFLGLCQTLPPEPEYFFCTFSARGVLFSLFSAGGDFFFGPVIGGRPDPPPGGVRYWLLVIGYWLPGFTPRGGVHQ